MAKSKKPINLSKVKKTARRRVALIQEASQRATKARQYTNAANILRTDNPGLLQAESPLEQTLKFRQTDLLPHLNQATAAKSSFRLDLEHTALSPYNLTAFSRSSRSILVASRKGHVSITEWRKTKLITELHLNETIRSGTFLHNDAFFALSQKQHAYIYDSSGAQVHALRQHRNPGGMVFLPYHLLLATASHVTAQDTQLVYTDTSTGDVVASPSYGGRHMKLGGASHLAVNPSSGIVHMAHTSGVVSLWSPVSERPLARIFTNAGGVRQVAVSKNGQWMVTTGGDATVKLWDLRTFKPITSWRAPAITTALTISQRDLVAYSFGATVQVWAPGGDAGKRNVKKKDWGGKPYMMETYSGCRVTSLDFCPFEDVLSVCHEHGVRSMIVPGAGEPTFDTSAPNPYETRKQRSNNEVRNLLDKLPMASIVLDTKMIGGLEQDPLERQREFERRERAANLAKMRKKRMKKKAKGRNRISKRVKKRQDNVIDAKTMELKEVMEERRRTHDAARKEKELEKRAIAAGTAEGRAADDIPEALLRFTK